jgi:hypothetical protein
MRKVKRYCIATALCSLCTGCTANHGSYALLSNRAVVLEQVTKEQIERSIPTRGESTCFGLIIFPLKGCSLQAAMAQALRDGDYLTDARVEYRQVNLFPLLLKQTWVVEGKRGRLGR